MNLLGDVFNRVNNMMAQMQEAAVAAQNAPFKAKYRAYPVAFVNKDSLEGGDKILLPASALHQLSMRRVVYPMLFRITNGATGHSTHCGVMEFTSEEGIAYLPYWMMQNLLVEDGGIIDLENVTLKPGSYVKLQPHAYKFTQLPNPRAILEKALRTFSCLTKGDTIKINFNEVNYYLDVVECRPQNAVSVIETDVQVEFDPPKDMKEHESKQVEPPAPAPDDVHFSMPTSSAQSSAAVPISPVGPTPAVAPATPSGSAQNGGSYFSNLKSSGYSLKNKPRASTSSPAAGTPSVPKPVVAPAAASSSNSRPVSAAASSSPAPARVSSASVSTPSSSSPPSAVPASASSDELPAQKTQIVRQGSFDYVYEIDPKTKKQRLIRRIPVPAAVLAASAAPAASSAQPAASAAAPATAPTNSGSATGFKAFGGTGYRLA